MLLTKQLLNSRKAIVVDKESFKKLIRGFKHAGHGVYVNKYGTKVIEVYGQDQNYIAYVDHKISINKAGYKQCGISNNTVLVHRLVGLAWVNGYQEGLEIDHIDRNSLNNFYKNLRWVDHSTNMKNRIMPKTYKKRDRRAIYI